MEMFFREKENIKIEYLKNEMKNILLISFLIYHRFLKLNCLYDWLYFRKYSYFILIWNEFYYKMILSITEFLIKLKIFFQILKWINISDILYYFKN
jgi:hypothetical protein